MADVRKAPFRFWSFLFSLKGRVSFWSYVVFEVTTRLLTLAGGLLLRHMPGASFQARMLYNLPVAIFGLAVLWPKFALIFKRFHNANLTGMWALIYFAPLYISRLFCMLSSTGLCFSRPRTGMA